MGQPDRGPHPVADRLRRLLMMAPHLERHGHPRPATPPLVLVHGLGGDRLTWTPILERLAAEREVVVVELPGFGSAPPLPAAVEPSPAALAAALRDALLAEGLATVDVAGVSLGAWVALELADDERLQVRTVVALAPAGFWPRPLAPSRGVARRVGRAASPLLSPLLRSRRLRARVLRGALGGPARHDHGQALALIRGYVDAPDFERVGAAMRRRTFDPARLGPLSERSRVHVVWAGLDPLVAAPRTPLAPAVHVHQLPDSGHMPMFDEPERVAALLLDLTAADPDLVATGPETR